MRSRPPRDAVRPRARHAASGSAPGAKACAEAGSKRCLYLDKKLTALLRIRLPPVEAPNRGGQDSFGAGYGAAGHELGTDRPLRRNNRMRGSNKIAGIVATLLGVALLIGAPAANAAPLVSSVESKCAGTIGKASAKVAKTYGKEVSKCRDADISGSTIGACPTAENLAKVSAAATKLTDSVNKKCQSTCSISGLPCIADALCPPVPSRRLPRRVHCRRG